MKDRLHQLADLVLSWTGAFATITLTQISLTVSIIVGVVTAAFTIDRWIYWRRNRHNTPKDP